MIQSFNRLIAYTEKWKPTFIVGLIVGASLSILLIFLQPFDTDKSVIPYKNLRLAGYTIAVLLPILLLHPIENYIYKRQKNQWYVLNEIVYILPSLLVVLCSTYLYKGWVMDSGQGLSWRAWKGFLTYAGIPFLPILGPLWVYFRIRFGFIRLPESKKEQNDTLITLIGTNKSDQLTLITNDFVYAQAQQNYVSVVYKEGEEIKQEMIRATLSRIHEQLPEVYQVHRSYLVNLYYLKTVKGNVRKREMLFTLPLEPIPVSQKYFEALQYKLSNSSLKRQLQP